MSAGYNKQIEQVSTLRPLVKVGLVRRDGFQDSGVGWHAGHVGHIYLWHVRMLEQCILVVTTPIWSFSWLSDLHMLS